VHLRELAQPCIVVPSTSATVGLYVNSPTHLAISLGLLVPQPPNISFNRTPVLPQGPATEIWNRLHGVVEEHAPRHMQRTKR